GAMQGLLVGLVVGELAWMVLAAWSTGRDRAACLAAAPHAALVGAALVALQIGPIVADVGPISRSVKAGIVGAIALVAVVWIAVGVALVRAEVADGGGDRDA
ncbi:MAG: hypothetical protein ACP5KN_04665, partial [Armatimonadota bacterium]